MASYHLSARIGKKGKGTAHAEYISRQGKYSARARYEDLEARGSAHMPKWAEQDPTEFWRAADAYERANGSAYREIEIALPREMTTEQRRELVEDFLRQELGGKHAYQWAIHTPKAALEGGEQPHAHIMYSQRRLDGIERDPAQFFMRANTRNPEKGGAKKVSGGKTKDEMEAELLLTRKLWADVQNEHLERHGYPDRVDHRSLEDQGIDRTPEQHFGPGRVGRITAAQDAELAAVLERRAAEGAMERADAELEETLIDLSGDLRAAKAARAAQERPTNTKGNHHEYRGKPNTIWTVGSYDDFGAYELNAFEPQSIGQAETLDGLRDLSGWDVVPGFAGGEMLLPRDETHLMADGEPDAPPELRRDSAGRRGLTLDLSGNLDAAKAAREYAARIAAEFKADQVEQARIERMKEGFKASLLQELARRPEEHERDRPSGPSI
jgi:hypothetical protein